MISTKLSLERHVMLNQAAKTLAIAAFGALFPAFAMAMEPAWVGARVGTNGLGAEVGVRIIPTIVVRGVVQGYDLDYDRTISGIAYKGKLSLGSIGAQIDFRPPLLPFYATAGVYSNNNKYNFAATPSGSVNVGNATYQGAQVGTLTSKANFEDIAYYGGLGVRMGLGPVEAALEAGLNYQGEPNVNFTASGPIATNAAFQADLARESRKIVNELDNAKYLPMITLTTRWKF
jgi:hypothetical protein